MIASVVRFAREPFSRTVRKNRAAPDTGAERGDEKEPPVYKNKCLLEKLCTLILGNFILRSRRF
jgi:hypothetical protein